MTTPRQPSPGAGSKQALFAFAAVALVVFTCGMLLLVYNLNILKERRTLTELMRARKKDATYGSLYGPLTEEQRTHVASCYLEGEAPDPDALFWSPRNMPTPFIGYAPEPGLQMGRHFNMQQLNMEGPLELPKPAGELRIFLTGASVALGGGAPSDSATIAAFMQRALEPHFAGTQRMPRVICGAACGWSSTQERILIENRLSEWQPDAVVTLTGANDMWWGHGKFSTLDGRTYDDHNFLLLANGGLRLAGEPVYSDVPPIRPEAPIDPQRVADRFLKNVRQSASVLQQGGTPYLVALQPILAEDRKPLTVGERALIDKVDPDVRSYLETCYQAFRKRLFDDDGRLRPELATAHPNLHAIDLRDLFRERSEPCFLDLVHMGSRGNAIVGEALANHLLQLSLSTSPSDPTP